MPAGGSPFSDSSWTWIRRASRNSRSGSIRTGCRKSLHDNRGLYVGQATDGIIDAVTRLLELMSQPEDANLLGPLVVDEILIRLLRSPIGSRAGADWTAEVRRAEGCGSCVLDTHAFRPARDDRRDGRLRPHERVFVHERFKAVTSMSPLQYQKVLRLHEARRLMLFQSMDASDACRRVGYLSPSQFSREGYRTVLRERADERHRSPARGRVRCGQVGAEETLTSSVSSRC